MRDGAPRCPAPVARGTEPLQATASGQFDHLLGGLKLRPVANYIRALQGLLVPFVTGLAGHFWLITVARSKTLFGQERASRHDVVVVEFLNH